MSRANQYDSLLGSGVNAVVGGLLVGLGLTIAFVPLGIAWLPNTVALWLFTVAAVVSAIVFARYDESIIATMMALLPLAFFGKIYVLAGIGCRAPDCEATVGLTQQLVLAVVVTLILGGIGYGLGKFFPQYVDVSGLEIR